MLRAVLLSLCLILALVAGPLAAQGGASALPDYDAWARTANRAEEAVEAGRASSAAMQALRAQLVDWRQKFAQAQSTNAQTITTVQAQLQALGPAPTDGAEEAPDIAAQRSELNRRLGELSTPSKTAEVAQSRAVALIASIDKILRERQTEALTQRGPMPVNPANWLGAWTEMKQSLLNTRNEILNAWSNPNQRAAFRNNLPLIVLLSVLGLVLLVYGRRLMTRLTMRLQAGPTTPLRWLLAFGFSLGQVIVPLIGVIFIVGAGFLTELPGLRATPLLTELVNAGAMILFAMWLGGRIFPRVDTPRSPTHLTPEQARLGRFLTASIGWVLAARELLRVFSSYDIWSPRTSAVVFLPLIVLGAVLIWRIGALMGKHVANEARLAQEKDEPLRYAVRIYRLLGQGLYLVALAAPLLAAAGYARASQGLIFPVMESLLLLAFVLIVQRVLAELYVLFRRREEVRDGLVPILAGMFVFLFALPKFALIWGVSKIQLLDFWQRFQDGFQIGGTTISPEIFLTFAVVFSLGFMATRLIQGTLKNSVLPKTKMDQGAQNALISGLGYVGIFLAALIAITAAGIDLSSLAIVAGALSVGIGFGLQTIVSNFVSGIILLIERPITEGDWIEVGGTHGTVRSISVRSTRIETFDRSDVILPNADLISGKVTNYTRGNTVGRVIVPVGVSYGSDTRKVEKILREIAEAHPMVLAHPAPNVLFQGFGADSMDFEIRAILRDVNWVMSVKSDMNHEIARRFAEEGVEIPFAQRDIWIRNPEVLPGAKPGEDAPREAGDALLAEALPADREPAGDETEDDEA